MKSVMIRMRSGFGNALLLVLCFAFLLLKKCIQFEILNNIHVLTLILCFDSPHLFQYAMNKDEL